MNTLHPPPTPAPPPLPWFPGKDIRHAVTITRGNHLPHWTLERAVYHVCFRLADSLPQEKLRELDRLRRRIAELRQNGNGTDTRSLRQLEDILSETFGKHLDEGFGSCLLRRDGVADAMSEVLHHGDGREYRLHAFGIMPNHVHVIAEALPGHPFQRAVQAWKSVGAHRINRLLGRTGALWQVDRYDHVIRTAREYAFQMDYVAGNNGVCSWRVPRTTIRDGGGAVATSPDLP